MSAINLMTPDAIRERLEEIKALEARHAARDLDAELGAALRAGGDLDALETAQLEAERQARRLRVERAALTAELPEAIKRDGTERVATLIDTHDGLAKVAKAKADAVADAWAAFKTAVAEWVDLQDEATAITRKAVAICEETGASMKVLGTFQSHRLVEIIMENRDTWRGLGSAESPLNTLRGPQGQRID
ncbi:MAG: hypothetical protein Devi2KO_14950 [Devosia indica]